MANNNNMSKYLARMECRLEALEFEVRELRRFRHFQYGYFEGLKHYVTSRIAEVAGTDQGWEVAKAIYAMRRAYDERISKMENDHPALAAEMDVRSLVSKEYQDDLYFPKEPEA
ncbi:MAG: hypothetical protein JWR69_1178 [Pedosphaera sp.]|nr:hypothetical protein [Pedosphaera sp.]